MKKFISILLSAAMLAASIPAFAAEYKKVEGQNGILYSADSTTRKMEKLDRGLFVQNSNGVNYLSWRLFAEEDAVYGTAENNVSFRIYKNGEPYAEETATTNYTDRKGKTTDTYQVAPIVNGVEGEKCEAVKPNNGMYFDIPLVKPEAETIITPSGQTVGTFNFSPTDASAGDLDGDGEYEIVVKWVSSEHDVGSPGDGIQSLSGTVRFAAYKLDGTKMWTQDINLGKNVYSSAHTVQFLVYDFDGDGKAEMMCQTSVGSKDAEGNYVSKAAKNDTSISGISDTTNANTDYRTDWGPVKTGKEFLTVFNGETGAAMDTIDLPIARGTDQGADFGDTSGNRSNRFVANVAYLDGVKPYAVYLRGYYFGRTGKQRTSIAGVSFDGKKLSADYRFDTQNGQPGYYSGAYQYVGQGNHNCTVADVDNDGKDEFLTGALCMEVDDQNRFRPRWCTYKEHGDALHIGNYDPMNDFLEFFTVHEDGDKDNKEGDYGYTNDQGVRCDFGMSVINAETGDIVFHKGNTKDTGRGIMADVGAGGYYQFAGVGTYRSDGGTNFVSESYGLSVNFRVFWDGDLYDELLDGTSVTSWDNNSKKMNEIFNAGAYDCVSVNGTKANPSLQADLFGDWREELIYPTSDGNKLRVFSTNIATKYKLKTLMSDGMYRSGAAAEQTCYNQPPHVSMYMGEEIFDNLIIPTPVPTSAPEGLTYAELVHTATSKWGSWGNNSGASYDNEKEFMNNDVDNAWSGAAYAQFKLPDDTITNAELTFTVLGESRKDREFKVYMSDADIDLTNLSVSLVDLFSNSRKDISSGTFTAPKNAEKTYTVDVTDLLEGKNGKTVTFIFTGNEGGDDLYGKKSQMAPVLELLTVKPTPTLTPTPTTAPTAEPTSEPTVDPTATPVVTPTPTADPTIMPTVVPTTTPTAAPTSAPTAAPTAAPDAPRAEIVFAPEVSGGTLIGSFTAKTVNISQPAKLILAVYDENGALLCVRIKDNDINGGEVVFDGIEISGIEKYSCAVFVWDDITSIKPLCEPARK